MLVGLVKYGKDILRPRWGAIKYFSPQAFGSIPRPRESLPFDRCQVTPLDDRGRWVRTTCQLVYMTEIYNRDSNEYIEHTGTTITSV